mgnify:CR=1 FL=1
MKKLCCILSICLLLGGCSGDSGNKSLCLVDGCYNEVVNDNTAYCEEHIRTKVNELYEQYNNIKLTDTQLTECRTVVDDYCEKLINTQSDINSIYIRDESPETSVFNIMYKCYVTRGDDVDLATIYVEMSDDGVFKVDKLEYDK